MRDKTQVNEPSPQIPTAYQTIPYMVYIIENKLKNLILSGDFWDSATENLSPLISEFSLNISSFNNFYSKINKANYLKYAMPFSANISDEDRATKEETRLNSTNYKIALKSEEIILHYNLNLLTEMDRTTRTFEVILQMFKLFVYLLTLKDENGNSMFNTKQLMS